MNNKECTIVAFMMLAVILFALFVGIQVGKIVGYECGALDQKNGNITWSTNTAEKVTYKLNPPFTMP